MKFILELSNWLKDWDTVNKVAILADELNFWGVAMPDHYLRSEGRDDNTIETWIALTYLASKTKNIHVGTLVTPISFRPPAILAKMISTLDVISNGRTFLGVGAGWSKREFETYSKWSEPKVRVDKTEEGLNMILSFWTDKKVNFEGKYYAVKDGVLEPKPLQKPHPPLLFGGFGKKMIQMAGKYADILFIPNETEIGFENTKKMALKSRGLDHKSKLSFASDSPTDKTNYNSPLQFKVETYFESVQRAKENGCEYYILSLPEDGLINTLNVFAKEIIPQFQ